MQFVCHDPECIKNAMYSSCVNKITHSFAVNLGTGDSPWFYIAHEQQQSINIDEGALNKEKCRHQNAGFDAHALQGSTLACYRIWLS